MKLTVLINEIYGSYNVLLNFKSVNEVCKEPEKLLFIRFAVLKYMKSNIEIFP